MPATPAQAELNERLWNSYTASREPRLREQIIVQYAPLVKYVVGRLAINLPTVIDSDDVISYGTIGLIDAVERFDPSRGIKFETYAIARIRGAIIDALRQLDQIPRTARQRAREIEAAIAELEAKLKRPPTDEEVAKRLGMDVDKYREVCVRTSVVTLSLDSLLSVDDEEGGGRAHAFEDPDSPDPVSSTERREMEGLLVLAVKKLPERERLVLSLYYYEELTMKEISRVMEISESRVCQLHAQAILRLRATMRNPPAAQP
ncbi:MAG TPA: FliA/WhiG family RNA polymerase sigma factor [Chloroflexota bacterium]|jgi:RNA polymerase sigma factor for flagellar operon FliA|nr:FliA/WhiG family RNA polymerase sigma factor [Chloroflexota bacterium]